VNTFDYLVADQLDVALAEYAGGQVTLKAGGIDLLDLMKERIATPQTVLSIDGLAELRYIREEADGVHVGSLSTLADLGRSELLAAKYAALHHSAAHAATPQIRERATVGGNLCQRPRCWYFRNEEFDCLKKGGATCFAVEGENRYHAIFGGGPCHIVHPSNVAPALVALDALIVVRSAEGEPQRIKTADFFALPNTSLSAENVLKPGQVVSEIILPTAPSQSATIELREKQSFDWPLAIACVARGPAAAGGRGAWRVCLGAVAPIPWLSQPAMDVLGDKEMTPELAAAAGEAAATGAQPMSENSYKLQLVKVATKRALLAATGLEVPSWN
jgi:xanthine dehydrogenase YagS FAD-binding subunit